jgi:hypothetical protein
MTVTLYVLDVDDFRPLAEVAAKDPDLSVVRRGSYYEVSGDAGFEIDRNATGCRNALWYSAVAALSGGRVTRWDSVVLIVEPSNEPTVGDDR